VGIRLACFVGEEEGLDPGFGCCAHEGEIAEKLEGNYDFFFFSFSLN